MIDPAVIADVKARARIVDVVSGRGVALSKHGKEHLGRCPFHDDDAPSLRVNAAKNVWRCDPCDTGGDAVAFVMRHDGLAFPEALRKLGAEVGVVVDGGAREQTAEPKVVATYRYSDAAGVVLAVKRRWEPAHDCSGRRKSFTWEDANGRSGQPKPWTPVLYRYPEVLTAIGEGDCVYVVEGEKCADALVAVGCVATTNEDGAGKWRREHSDLLRDARVVLLPDNDDAGRKHADAVRRLLVGVAAVVDVVELPDLPPKGDVVDYLAANDADALRAAVDARRTQPGARLPRRRRP